MQTTDRPDLRALQLSIDVRGYFHTAWQYGLSEHRLRRIFREAQVAAAQPAADLPERVFFRPVSAAENNRVLTLLRLSFPRGASSALIGSRSGLGTVHAEAVCRGLADDGLVEHTGIVWRLL